MATKTTNDRLRFPVRTAAEWTQLNPALMKGEFGIEADTGYVKYGDGIQHWNDLSYVKSPHAAEADHATSADTATKATQDSDGNTINRSYLKRTNEQITGDFDNYTTEGIYTYASSTSATVVAHAPISGNCWGRLLVLNTKYSGTGNNYWLTQVAFQTTGEVYYRQHVNNGNWSEWKRLAFTTDTVSGAINDSDGNAINTTYLKRSGGTLTGWLKITNTNTVASTYDFLRFQASNTGGYGLSVGMGSGGPFMIGAGESMPKFWDSTSNGDNENLYLGADGSVVVKTGVNSVTWDNAKTFTFGTNGTLTANGFAGALTGDVTGNCSGSSGSCTGNAATATKLANARNINVSDSDGTNTGTAFSFNGTAAGTIKLPATIKATITGGCSGNAGSATKLATARTIDGVDFNGTAAISHYGTCGTAAATAAKVAACTSFKLVTGARIIVKFTVTNTAANPTLNVNSTGAKAIYYRGAAITAGYLANKRVIEFVYDGSHYEVIGNAG